MFLLIVGAVVAVGRYYAWCKGAGAVRQPVRFTVADGASGDSVVAALHDRGVIRCGGLVGNLLLHGSGKASSIRAGSYSLTTNMTFDAAIRELTTPPVPVPTVEMTIPEGYRLTQIAERVQQDLGIPAKQFLGVAKSGTYALAPWLPPGTPTTEGFLFPKTYRFVKKTVTADEVVRTLLNQFKIDAGSLPWSNAKRMGVSPYQVVTIASMIEREAKVPGDRAKIAAVIYNRLKDGMPLGIDATIGYIDPDPSNGLTASDFKIDSPYNTRLHTGLPPTPIASPGLPSLQAALDPAHVPYLYYVLCGADGHHKFSDTSAQFEHDVATCLG